MAVDSTGGHEILVQFAALNAAVTNALPEQITALGDTRALLTARTVPAEWLGRLPGSSQAATAHANNITASARQLEVAAGQVEEIIGHIRATSTGVHHFDETRAEKQNEQHQMLAQVAGETATDASAGAGTPSIDERDAANRTELQLLLSGSEIPPERAAQYQRLLDGGMKILEFEPDGNGRIVGLIGNLDEHTREVGVFVPGTGASIENVDYYAHLTGTFADPGRAGGPAMVLWMNGDLPGVVEAPDPEISQALGPQLRDFVNDDLRGMVGPDVQVTVVGHSYGGAIVGLADAAGMQANNVVHVASAGMGHGVPPGGVPNDFPVTRYTISYPNDLIHNSQGGLGGYFGYNHGPDPDGYPGVIEIPPGLDVNGNAPTWDVAHSGILTQYSDSWQSIFNVITGGPVPTDSPIRPTR